MVDDDVVELALSVGDAAVEVLVVEAEAVPDLEVEWVALLEVLAVGDDRLVEVPARLLEELLEEDAGELEPIPAA